MQWHLLVRSKADLVFVLWQCFAKTATLTSWYGGAIIVGGSIVDDASIGTALYQGSVWTMSTWAGFLAMRLRKGCTLFVDVLSNDWALRWPVTQLGRTICLVELICVVENNCQTRLIDPASGAGLTNQAQGNLDKPGLQHQTLLNGNINTKLMWLPKPARLT